MSKRIVISFICLILLWMSLLARAVYLQVIPNDKMAKIHNRQFSTAILLPGRRGNIVDRKGRDLASSVLAYSVFADPSEISQPKKTAKILAKKLNLSYNEVYKKIKNKNKRFVWLERQMDTSKKEEIEKLKLHGIGFLEEAKRVYPNNKLLSNVMGFVGRSGDGLEGLELKYDKELSGEKKRIELPRDARGRPLIINGKLYTETPDGYNVELSIDLELQYRLEQELASTVENYEADSAVGVILNPMTSEILAIANLPSFDPNHASQYKPEQRRNRSLTDPFEPGSTMKTFTLATAIDLGLFQPSSNIYCEKGKFQVGPYIIREADAKYNFENLSLTEILAKSSNVGTSKVALKIGEKRLIQKMQDFGFGAKTQSGMMGESAGLLPKKSVRPHLLANISFGHGMSATALQIANAYASIANGGILHQPYIVKKVSDTAGNIVEENHATQIRRVISEKSAQKLRLMLHSATEKGGTGERAKVASYTVAGKTGTAQKAKKNAKGYEQGAYISSFAGFIPADQPRYVIYIAVDNPRKAFYGSEVAAPIFSKIASFAVMKDAMKPMQAIAKSQHKNKSRSFTTQEVQRYTLKPRYEKVPEILGLSAREVIQKMYGQNLQIQFHGHGKVARTEPEVGEFLVEKQKLQIYLQE